MRQLYKNYTLYNDIPQRHYRQITALFEDDVISVLTNEGTILTTDPFEREKTGSTAVICADEEEAVAEAKRQYESSVQEGWFDYHPAMG